MASETRSDRPHVDWARFGLSEQNEVSNDVTFVNKPPVLDESSYGGEDTRANELFTEEQVSILLYSSLSIFIVKELCLICGLFHVIG